MFKWYQLMAPPCSCWNILIGDITDITLFPGNIANLLLGRNIFLWVPNPLAELGCDTIFTFLHGFNINRKSGASPHRFRSDQPSFRESQAGAFFGGLGISISWTGQGLFFSMVVPTAGGDAVLGGRG